jgi:hypothetical protein
MGAMTSHRLLAGVGLIAGCLLAAPASASIVMALDLPGLVSRADHIAVVDVMSVTSAWDDNHEQIVSTVELSAVERWKGAGAPSHYTVVQLGGTVGDLTMVVHGMSQFTVGERALVFLRGTPQRAAVVGMAQGKRAVRRDAQSGNWLVHSPDRAGATFLRTTPASSSAPVFDMRARPLDALRDEVRALASQPSKAQ